MKKIILVALLVVSGLFAGNMSASACRTGWYGGYYRPVYRPYCAPVRYYYPPVRTCYPTYYDYGCEPVVVYDYGY